MKVTSALEALTFPQARTAVRRAWQRRHPVVIVGALLLVAGLLTAGVLVGRAIGTPSAQTAGYPAIFLVNLLGSASFVLPLPGLAFTAWGGLNLDPFTVALVAATAEAIGDTTGYLLGYSGRGLLIKIPLLHHLEGRVAAWLKRWGWLTMTVFAAIPNPAFDVLGVAAGSLRFPLWQFIIFVWIGKLAKTLTVAYLGAQGVKWLLGLGP